MTAGRVWRLTLSGYLARTSGGFRQRLAGLKSDDCRLATADWDCRLVTADW